MNRRIESLGAESGQGFFAPNGIRPSHKRSDVRREDAS